MSLKHHIVLLTAILIVLANPTMSMAQEGRPLIMLLHGRNQQDKSDDQLKAEWFPALQAGLKNINQTDLLKPDDVVMVFYQDLYRSGVAVVCPADEEERRRRLGPFQTERDVAREQYELAILETRSADGRRQMMGQKGGAASVFTDEERAEAKTAANRAKERENALRRTFEVLERSVDAELSRVAAEEAAKDQGFRKKFLPGLVDKVKEYFAKALANEVPKIGTAMGALFPDTNRYITERRFRCSTDARLSRAVESAAAAKRPVIVVGHSMGTLVAYNMLFHDDVAKQTLNQPPTYSVHFVSLGSQLGIPPLVEAFAGGFGHPPVPRSLQSWRNIRGNDDYVAPALIQDLYEVTRTPYSEYEIATEPGNPHSISSYLSNPAVAITLAYTWCKAFMTTATVPAQCAVLTDLPSLNPLPGGARRRWPR